MKGFYSENFKTLKKDKEEDTGRWKDLPHLWTGRTIHHMVVLWKQQHYQKLATDSTHHHQHPNIIVYTPHTQIEK